jgi:ketosteroid isomerase-like protein
MEYRNNRAGLVGEGRDGWRKIMEAIFVVLPDRRIELRDVIAEGDRVALLYRYTATLAQDATFGQTSYAAGDSLAMDFCSVLQLRDGLVRRWRDYADLPS